MANDTDTDERHEAWVRERQANRDAISDLVGSDSLERNGRRRNGTDPRE